MEIFLFIAVYLKLRRVLGGAKQKYIRLRFINENKKNM